MWTRTLGLLTGLALLGGGAALADDRQKEKRGGASSTQQSEQAQQEDISVHEDEAFGGSGLPQEEQPATGGTGQEGVGGSGQQGQSGQTKQGQTAQGQKELIGRVAKAEPRTLYVEDRSGAIVELKVDRGTRFDDPNVKSARDLREGQEVRASFERRGVDNIARSISQAEPGAMDATGGSGQQGDRGINQPVYPDPSGVRRSDQEDPMSPLEEPGTGGSGIIILTPEENPDVSSPGSDTGRSGQPGDIGTTEEPGNTDRGVQGNPGTGGAGEHGTGSSGDDGIKGY